MIHNDTQETSKIGLQAGLKAAENRFPRRESVLTNKTLFAVIDLRRPRSAWRPIFEVSWVYMITIMVAFSPIAAPKVMSKEAYVYGAKNQKHILVLYYSPYCPYSNKVLRYLKSIHKQVPMENVADDPQAKAQFKKLGGKMQVPCLVIDREPMYESNDIIYWLSQHQDELESAKNTAACRMIEKMVQKPALRRKISSSGSIPKLFQKLK